MYISDYCEVNYEEKFNIVLVKWKNFCCNQDYRKPLEYALDIIKQQTGIDFSEITDRAGYIKKAKGNNAGGIGVIYRCYKGFCIKMGEWTKYARYPIVA